MISRVSSSRLFSKLAFVFASSSFSAAAVTGAIKANFPTHIALRTASPVNSDVILGVKGAEKLCGKGDMLLMRSDSSELVRLQGFSA